MANAPPDQAQVATSAGSASEDKDMSRQQAPPKSAPKQ